MVLGHLDLKGMYEIFLEKAEFEFPDLFQTRNMHFEFGNMVNMHGHLVSLKFIVNFELTCWILNWAFFSYLWVQNLFGTHPNF